MPPEKLNGELIVENDTVKLKPKEKHGSLSVSKTG